MNPSAGRRPATRGIFAIEQQEMILPNPIALDTSFVVEALIATQPLHRVCSAFLTRIGDSGVSVATSELLRVELAEAAFAIALKERWGGQWRRHRTDGRSRPRAGRLLNDTISRYDEMLGTVTQHNTDVQCGTRGTPGGPACSNRRAELAFPRAA